MRKKFLTSLASLTLLVAMVGTVAYAGTTYTDYNTTVARLNGNGYSGYQTKETGGANGYIKSEKVGGDDTCCLPLIMGGK